jgi:pimeloyl-ACP methyl ester carboxylesterase
VSPVEYVLVHGGFVGGWCWRVVADRLRAAGNEVFTPTLTGLGERAHLLRRDVGLDTHVDDVLGVLTCEALTRVVLVGHCSSSVVVAAVAERAPERLRHLVYVDTIPPENGQSWLDAVGPIVSAMLLERARVEGDGWRVPIAREPPRFAAHPLAAASDRLSIGNPAAKRIPRTFVFCTNKHETGAYAALWPEIAQAAARARAAGWGYRELATGHEPMLTMPNELAAILLELAERE